MSDRLKVWIYCDTTNSLKRKEHILREYCSHYGYTAEIITDRCDLIRQAPENRVNLLVMYSMEDLNRITKEQNHLIQHFEHNHVAIYLVKEGQYISSENKLVNLIKQVIPA